MNNHIVNSASISKEEKRLQNWSISKEPFKKIYQIGNFNLFKNYNIKTCESTSAINNSLVTIKLLVAADIDRYKKDFECLHICLI